MFSLYQFTSTAIQIQLQINNIFRLQDESYS